MAARISAWLRIQFSTLILLLIAGVLVIWNIATKQLTAEGAGSNGNDWIYR